MVRRRTFLASVGTAFTATTAGCGFILGNEPAEFEADPSAVSDAVLSETGYEFIEHERNEIEREFEAGGESRSVIATNVRAKHEKSIGGDILDTPAAAVFTSLTTPQVEVLGQTFNPIEDMSAADLAERVQGQYETFADVEKQRESEVTINGETTTESTFTAEAVYDDSPLEVMLHITDAVELGDDFVVTFGSYPKPASGEEENIRQLMEAVESA